MAGLERLQELMARMKIIQEEHPGGVIQNIRLNPEPEEDLGPKHWVFEGSVEDLDVPSLIASLTKPSDAVDYSTPESIYNFNRMIQQYGQHLYETKYSSV